MSGGELRLRVSPGAESLRVVWQGDVPDGWEPHFVVIFGDVKKELEILGNMLNIEVCTY